MKNSLLKPLSIAAVLVTIFPCLFACHNQKQARSANTRGNAPAELRKCISEARAQLSNRNYEEALKTAAAAISLAPNEHIGFLCHGYALFKLNQSRLAINDFDEAVRLAPQDYQSFEYRAAAFQSIKRFRRAISDFKQALAAAPVNPPVQSKLYRELGSCYLSFGRLQDAMACLSQAIKMSPDDSTLYASRATSELHLHKVQESLLDSSKAIQIDPSNAEAYQVRSRAFWIFGKTDLAKSDELVARKLFAAKMDDAQQHR